MTGLANRHKTTAGTCKKLRCRQQQYEPRARWTRSSTVVRIQHSTSSVSRVPISELRHLLSRYMLFVFFTALQICRRGLHLSICLSVCPSVCLFFKRVDCDKTKQISADILIPHERAIHLIFRHAEWLVGVIPLYLKFWAKLTAPLQKRRFSIDIRS